MNLRPRLVLPILAASLAGLPARAQLELPSGATGTPPMCLTDIRGSLAKLQKEPRRAPPPPVRTPSGGVLHSASVVPQITVIDATCTDGNCPAQERNFHGYTIYEVDTVSAASRFFAEHPDTSLSGWDEVVFFTTFFTTSFGGAYYMPMSNDVSGIAHTYLEQLAGGEKFNMNAQAGTGSRGFLKGTVLMSDWHTCKSAKILGIPCDNKPPYDGSQRGVLGILGQEVGHRWGSFFYFQEHGRKSDDLLGRDLSHWSYYVDTGGSPMEGNKWEPLASGSWQLGTVDHLQYGALDLYAMGVLPKEEVPPTLLVRSPSPAPCTDNKLDANTYMGCQTNASTPPAEGVSKLGGQDRQVSIDDIVASEGERLPKFPSARRTLYLAFALLELPGQKASAAEQQTLDTLRRTFTRAFYDGTNRRLRPITTLSRRDDLGLWDFILDSEGWKFETGGATWTPDAISFPNAATTTMTNDNLELDAAKEKVLHVKLATGRLSDIRLRVRWSTETTGDWSELEVPVPATGIASELEIPLDAHPEWKGLIRRMQLEVAPVNAPPTGDVSVDLVETSFALPSPDTDGDFVPDAVDNCPGKPNTNQHDSNANGTGDACEDTGSAADGAGCGCDASSGIPGLFALAALALRRRRRA